MQAKPFWYHYYLLAFALNWIFVTLLNHVILANIWLSWVGLSTTASLFKVETNDYFLSRTHPDLIQCKTLSMTNYESWNQHSFFSLLHLIHIKNVSKFERFYFVKRYLLKYNLDLHQQDQTYLYFIANINSLELIQIDIKQWTFRLSDNQRFLNYALELSKEYVSVRTST